MDNNLIRIGGLWINKTKDNVQYLSGNWGSSIKILVFKNKNKRSDSKDPDYQIFLAPNEPKQMQAEKEESEDF